MPSITTENYLKAIYQLREKHPEADLVRLGDLAMELEVTPGTITTMIRSLADRGLVDYHIRCGVQLTPEGELQAAGVVRRHRLIELFLVNVLQMDWAEVHEDAEALEHAVSSRVLNRMDAMMGHPARDPHGDPIPGNTSGHPDPRRVVLHQVEVGTTYEVSRVENQNPEVLERIADLGLKPGTSFRPVSMTGSGGTVQIDVDSTPVSVPAELAGWIRVKAIS